MTNTKIRVRYAPSPTGFLHIGGARSALFNYLYAKHYHGDFVLRIEDTDIERNVAGAEESQINDLIWLGIVPDESPYRPNPKYAPYRQTEKLAVYEKYANQLIAEGKAYKCYCSEEELALSREQQIAAGIAAPQYDGHCRHLTAEQIAAYEKEGRVPTIRLRMPDNQTIAFHDLVRNDVIFNTNDIGDWIIVKSNGIPTYNFAVVIDDHLMDITHVFRGEEHLSNTPRQIQLYRYFDWPQPEFAHMTLIINENGKKLSKRDLNILQFMSQYRDLGYLPQAIFNFILLLGWSPANNQEFFTTEEAITAFDGQRLSASPSTFDPQKMMWLNAHYIKQLSAEDYLVFIMPFIKQVEGIERYEKDQIAFLANLFKNEIKFGSEIKELAQPLLNFQATADSDELLMLEQEKSREVIAFFSDLIQKAPNLEPLTIKEIFKTIQKNLEVKGPALYMPIRLALTGRSHGVELVNIIKFLGLDETLKRLTVYR
ncbi:MAG: glutamate--tRNA ligase [Bacilli bacterium]|jgi:nondiscriminating glutamyl-tRNA synthetase|nr:glutamate--tRNA ligase [Bacilli bacterium]